MPITTIFLDLYNTLLYSYPPRETRQMWALKEFAYEVEEASIQRGYLAADHYYTEAGMKAPIHTLGFAERKALYAGYQQVMMEDIGLRLSAEEAEKIYARYSQYPRENRLYPDVIPALAAFKEAGLKVGLITNVTDDPAKELENVGLTGRFDVVAASCVVGFEKPDPRIFQAAMETLGVGPDEVVHVGDQYLADIDGARAAGIRGILLDRNDLQRERDPERIISLLDLLPHLKNGRS